LFIRLYRQGYPRLGQEPKEHLAGLQEQFFLKTEKIAFSKTDT